MQTRDVGPFYWHPLRYPVAGAPRWEAARTTEIEAPYREGKGVAVRLGPRLALVLGKWSRPAGRTETEALEDVLGARRLAVELDDEEDLVVLGQKLRRWPGGSMGPEED